MVWLGKLIGFTLIGLTAGCAFLAWSVPTRSRRAALAIAAMVLWLASCFAFIGLLGIEAADAGGSMLSCPVRVDDSETVASRWSWVPPGIVCEYPNGEVGPTYWRIPAALALGAIPIVAVATWPRRKTLFVHGSLVDAFAMNP